jgi:hypothetical protein
MGSRIFTFAATVALVGGVSATALAQTGVPLTPSQMAVGCAPLPNEAFAPLQAPRITGSQDVVQRGTFGTPELLVVNAGTTQGVQVNQQFFVRRVFRTAATHMDKHAHMVQTAGWVRIVAANENMSIAIPDHACGDIREGDYLEPFTAPQLPEGNIFTAVTTGEQDFKNYSHILYAALERLSAGTGDFIVIDHGEDRNIAIGSHFAIWRDLQVSGVPLTAVGEATAVIVSPSRTVLLITRTRDAVFKSDIAVPRVEDGSAIAR